MNNDMRLFSQEECYISVAGRVVKLATQQDFRLIRFRAANAKAHPTLFWNGKCSVALCVSSQRQLKCQTLLKIGRDADKPGLCKTFGTWTTRLRRQC